MDLNHIINFMVYVSWKLSCWCISTDSNVRLSIINNDDHFPHPLHWNREEFQRSNGRHHRDKRYSWVCSPNRPLSFEKSTDLPGRWPAVHGANDLNSKRLVQGELPLSRCWGRVARGNRIIKTAKFRKNHQSILQYPSTWCLGHRKSLIWLDQELFRSFYRRKESKYCWTFSKYKRTQRREI